MIRYVLKRLLYMLLTMFAVTFVVFLMLHIAPGDPVQIMLGTGASPEAMESLRESLGLNDPLMTQFFNYLKNLILHFDMGTSYETRSAVTERILTAFPNTLKLACSAIAIASIFGVMIGVIAATKQNSAFDNATMFVALIGISMPVFWLGLLLILLFSVHLGWLPSSGLKSFKFLILPAITAGAQSCGMIARMTRSSMLEEIRKDHVRTLRAKGLSEFKITVQHVLRNAMIPIVTVIGLQFGSLMGGTMLTETIFGISGVGRLLIGAIGKRDYPVVLGSVLFVTFVYSIVNLVIDVLYAYLDPRIKAQYT